MNLVLSDIESKEIMPFIGAHNYEQSSLVFMVK